MFNLWISNHLSNYVCELQIHVWSTFVFGGCDLRSSNEINSPTCGMPINMWTNFFPYYVTNMHLCMSWPRNRDFIFVIFYISLYSIMPLWLLYTSMTISYCFVTIYRFLSSLYQRIVGFFVKSHKVCFDKNQNQPNKVEGDAWSLHSQQKNG